MIDKPLNQLNEFFNLTQTHTISGSAQLLYLHLFNLFNKSHWANSISVSDRDLITAMRLYESTGKPAGVQTLYRARCKLQSAGLIKFKSGKGNDVTSYELIRLYPVNTPVDTPVDTPANTPVDTLTPSIIRAREDVKTKDVKTKNTAAATTCARESFLNQTSPEIAETWLKYEGERLNGGQMLDFYNLEKLYGVEAVVEAIKEASRANKYQRLNYNFVKKVLEHMVKGVKKFEHTSEFNGGFVDNSQYAGVDTF